MYLCISRKRVYVMRTPSLVYIFHNDSFINYTPHSYSVTTYWSYAFSPWFAVWNIIPSNLVSCHIKLFMILQNTFAWKHIDAFQTKVFSSIDIVSRHRLTIKGLGPGNRCSVDRYTRAVNFLSIIIEFWRSEREVLQRIVSHLSCAPEVSRSTLHLINDRHFKKNPLP